jgi:hypothetical protein
MESVGFKEWAIVCDALGDGRQSIILRKGGIAESRDGFAFRHPEFFLFPTFFHEQVKKTRITDAVLPKSGGNEIEIRFFAKLELARVLISWERVEALEPFHILQPAIVRERFDYNQSGVHVALVRVFRLEPAWILPNEKSYGGCRSWVRLPERPAAMRFESVLADSEHAEKKEIFFTLVNGEQDVTTALSCCVGVGTPRQSGAATG